MNRKLTPEQKHILNEEGTEPPGSSPLNYEKGKALIIVWDAEPNFLNLILNMKVDLAGHLSLSLYQMFLKQKLTQILVIQEQNIIAKNVEGTMVIFLMMVLNQLEKDIAIMAFV